MSKAAGTTVSTRSASTANELPARIPAVSEPSKCHSLLTQDPRYFVLGEGSILHRTGYALSRSVVTRTRAGRRAFNLSEIGGNAVAAGISNAYHPRGDRTWTDTASRWGMQVMWDTLTNELKEFWPDIRRKI